MARTREAHHIAPNALPPDAVPIGPDYADVLSRIRRANSVIAHGAAIEATGRRYEDQPGLLCRIPPKRDKACHWYRSPNIAERALP